MSIFDWLKKAEEFEERELVKTNESDANPGALEQRVIQALRTVYDPEIPVNIYDLGLIYELDVDASGLVTIRMTLTAPGCPVAQTFPGTVEQAVKSVPGVTDARVELVWDPPWSREKMSEAARLELGMI
jgi:FeS assembly SUF system protein